MVHDTQAFFQDKNGFSDRAKELMDEVAVWACGANLNNTND
jgi:hypothetical protein